MIMIASHLLIVDQLTSDLVSNLMTILHLLRICQRKLEVRKRSCFGWEKAQAKYIDIESMQTGFLR